MDSETAEELAARGIVEIVRETQQADGREIRDASAEK
jgi:hypothetical protein